MVNVETRGAGRDLVLLHGWGVHRAVWNELANALADCCRVHAVDLPGYGSSPACRPCTLDHIVERLAAALPDGLTVCGWSFGGQLALRWAKFAPRQVDRLVLIATTPRFMCGADWEHGVAVEVFDRFVRDLGREPNGALHRFAGLQARGDKDARIIARRLRQCVAVNPPTQPDTLAAGLALLRATDLRREAGSIEQPALVLHGTNDAVAPRAAGAWLANALPDARWVELDGSGHAPFVAEPRLFARHLTEFCRE